MSLYFVLYIYIFVTYREFCFINFRYINFFQILLHFEYFLYAKLFLISKIEFLHSEFFFIQQKSHSLGHLKERKPLLIPMVLLPPPYSFDILNSINNMYFSGIKYY